MILFSVQLHSQITISPTDFKSVKGAWTGSLTYIDYSTNKPYTMPANLNIGQGKNENQWGLSYIYPNEPKANSRGKIKISDQGRKLNNHKVISKQQLSDFKVQITTEHLGKDNNKKALIRNIYILSERVLIIRKEVKFEDTETWFKRNEYNFKR